ncbi:MAG: hypothetical protein EP330_16750 [Deltaproteobacteria bacterium]|nr:MAG: hypothetical protein EP330_16750 [Deltaproteobacteria bacterium]
MPRWLAPTPVVVLFTVLTAWLALGSGVYLVSADSDSLFHILLGKLMWEQGGLLASEPTTWTYPDGHLSAHEWGSQLVLAKAWQIGGLSLVATVASMTIAGACATLLAWLQYRRVAWLPALLTVASAWIVSLIHFHARPHVVTWVFATLWVIGLEMLHRRELAPGKWLAGSAALLFLWVNLHGGFLYAFFLLGAYVLAGIVRVLMSDEHGRDEAVTWTARLAVAGAILLAVSALNPQGLAVHVHLLAVAGGSSTQGLVGDSAVPNLLQRPHLLLYVLGALFLMVAGKQRPAPREWLLVFMLAAMSLQSIRNFAVMSFAGAVVLGPRLGLLWDELSVTDGLAGRVARGLATPPMPPLRPDPWLAVAMVGLLGLGMSRTIEVDRRMQPLDAIEFVKTRPDLRGKRLLNSYNWGCTISWVLYPEHKTFINSWSDYHGNERVQRAIDLERLAPGWYDVIEELDVGWAIYKVNAPLTEALREKGWEEIYRDDTAAILVKPR